MYINIFKETNNNFSYSNNYKNIYLFYNLVNIFFIQCILRKDEFYKRKKVYIWVAPKWYYCQKIASIDLQIYHLKTSLSILFKNMYYQNIDTPRCKGLLFKQIFMCGHGKKTHYPLKGLYSLPSKKNALHIFVFEGILYFINTTLLYFKNTTKFGFRL